jgi:RND family efflux transporter MFP subunit
MEPRDQRSGAEVSTKKTVTGPDPQTASDPERVLWARFAESRSSEDFYRSWLALQCQMIAGVSGGLVVLGSPDRGRFKPVAAWPPRQSMKHLTAAAERALVERRGLLHKRESNGHGAPAEQRCDVAYPIEIDGQVHGVVVLEVDPRPELELQRVLRQLHWGSAWLEVVFRRDEAVGSSAARGRLQAVLDLVASAVAHPRFYEAATALVTGLATRLACDRVSLGFVHRGQAQIIAISHSADFKSQMNLVRAIRAAMDEALDQQATILYPEDPRRPTAITRAHSDLAREGSAGAVCTIPLVLEGRAIGALTFERPPAGAFDPEIVEVCEAVAALVGPGLEIQRREDRWVGAKVADSMVAGARAVAGPSHAGLKLGIGLMAAVMLFFFLAKGEYRVTAPGAIEARIRRAIVAPFNGYVAEARLRAGDVVRQGALLAVLDDRELRLERLKAAAQHEQLVKQYHQAMASHNAAQVQVTAAQVDQAAAQLALLNDQLSRTRLIAPFDGVVVSGDMSQSLGAPVERGQVLFEVAPLDAYRVVIQVDEREIAHLVSGQRGHLVLTGFPTDWLPFTVEKITPISTAREGRNFFRVEAAFDTTPGQLRPGMEGVAKVGTGRQRLAWIWGHQVVDWLRLTVWTWLP